MADDGKEHLQTGDGTWDLDLAYSLSRHCGA
jgi:hypothetical protein